MKYILLSIAAWIGMAFICSLSAQNIKSDKIEAIKVQASDIPSGFDLHLERLSKPGSSLFTQVRQYWVQDIKEPDLKLVSEEILKTNRVVGASSFQKWYHKNESGFKDMIEINIIISTSDEDLENTISYYTKDAFVAQFKPAPVPFVGEKSWSTDDNEQGNGCYTVMFCKSNVFVRLFLGIQGRKNDELAQTTLKIAKIIETKIKSIK